MKKAITTIVQNINPRHTNVILGEKENILYLPLLYTWCFKK